MLYTNKYILFDKIVNRVLNRKNVVWTRISPVKMSLRLLGKNRSNQADLRMRLNKCLGEISIVDLCDISSEEQQVIISNADQTLQHRFDYLGSGWTEINPIDWHKDFISGHKWEKGKFYADYKCVDSTGGYDIKVVWELNRCHHLLWLAEAYSLTHDRKYSKEIVEQISDWIDNNPLMYSINWTCSMDVSIRAVNWMYAVGIIIDSGDIDDSFSQKVYNSLFEHLFFIVNNLEKTIPYSGNHYLSDLVGLLFVSSIFPENFFARRCFNFAFKEFKREALIQISNDGTNYEHSISYHRLVAELFIFSYALLKRLNHKLPAAITDRFEKMIDYIAAYTKRSGLSPLIGDNDNGRLLPFAPRDFRRHEYMCSLWSALIGKNYAAHQKITAESLYASAGLYGIRTENRSYQEKHTALYQDNKLAIAKSDDIELIVTNSPFSLKRCVSTGAKGGTHTHPDALSFDLSFGGEDYIVDPGTYVYTSNPSLRNRLRSTTNHSTVVIDNLNQTDFDETNVFVQTNYIEGRILSVNEPAKAITGSYQFNNGCVSYSHKRTFEIYGNKVLITDIIECAGTHEILLNYHIATEISIESDGRIVTLDASKGQAVFMVKTGNRIVEPQIVDSLFSPSYGILQNSKLLQYQSQIKDGITIITEIKWEKK